MHIIKCDQEAAMLLFVGRFGNKADLYLGGISFAAGLKRTLVLPPFIMEDRVKCNYWHRWS